MTFGSLIKNGILFLVTLLTLAEAFQPPMQRLHKNEWNRGTITRRPMAIIDPTEAANTVSSTLNHLASQHPDPAAATAAAAQHTGQSLEAMMSTLYSTTVDGIIKPAQGHSQPLFGPADPFLSSGTSIAPTTKGLLADVAASTTGSSSVDGAAAALEPLNKLPEVAQAALDKGWKITDVLKFGANSGGDALPGFVKTGGILPQHSPFFPAETPATFAGQVEWSANFLNVIDKLPLAAVVYGLVEFFLLRPGVDLYKEDIEEEPTEVLVQTIAVTGVRLAVFTAIGFLTVVMFG